MRVLIVGILLLACGAAAAQPPGKAVYIPRELWGNDFDDPASQWCWQRMAYTDDVVLLWEQGFGSDPATAPDLQGQPMTVDVPRLMGRLQELYDFYRDSLAFILPGSRAEQYRMMVMLRYSLEGTAYGGDYDETIGALWVTPNRLQDPKLNCIAHELGHSFQSQIFCDRAGECWGGGGIFEMASQWMLWQVNPEWTTEENYHWQAFRQSFHLAFLADENVYRSPYVLEYWSMRHGVGEIARLFRAGREGETPAQTYMRLHGLTEDEMSDEMADCYSRLLTFDFPRVHRSHRHMAGQLVGDAPMGLWGFNVLQVPPGTHRIEFSGTPFRYQLVEVDAEGDATYHGIRRSGNIKVPRTGNRLYLVVVACPPAQDYKYTVKYHGAR